jgi:hypothetical protein
MLRNFLSWLTLPATRPIDSVRARRSDVGSETGGKDEHL